MIRYILMMVVVISIDSCAPSVRYRGYVSNYEPKPPGTPIIIYLGSENVPEEHQVLGAIRIDDDSGFSVNCDWGDVVEMAKEKARKVGGDAIQMTSIKEPDFWSTCYRITANVIKINAAIGQKPYMRQVIISSESSAQENQLKDVIKRVMPATVLVVTYDASGQILFQGSGFFVSEKGEVITNYHVMSGANSAVVKLPDGSVYKIIDVLAEDITSDLIKLKVDTDGSKVQCLPLNKALAEVGEKIVVIGSPQGLESTVSDGIVSAVRVVEGFGNIIQITAPISPGSSGSAVVNMKGEVVGVASAQILEGQNLNFVVPAGKITELKERKQAIARKDDSAKVQADDIYSYILGMFYYFKNDYEKALPFFKQYLQTHPDSFSDAWFYAGFCYGELGLRQEAIQAFKQAIKLKPDFAEAYYNLGRAYGNLGFWQEAIEAFKQAIRLEPDYAEEYYGLGWAYGNLNLWQEALQAYKQAVRLEPDYAEAYNNLGGAYNKLGLYQEALQSFKQAIKSKPDYAEAHYNLGWAYGSNLGLWQEALQSFKQAIKSKPDCVAAHCGLGVAYSNLGFHQEALQSFKQAIRLKPDDAKAHFGLGAAYFTKGDTGSALEEYKILKKLDTELANQLFNLIYK
jgi:tetratricopeptide (TPR) repeat protein